MKKLIITIGLVPLLALGQQDFNEQFQGTGFVLHYDLGDAAQESIKEYTQEGLQKISDFFDKPFKKKVNVYLFLNRARLDAQWRKDWGMPEFESECWMVGSGILSRLDLLSPSAWQAEACEHDSQDSVEIRQLVVHELTHVLHSDYNQSPEFNNINNIDWFVEGLATYASGQLDKERYEPMVAFVKETGGPTELANFWKGQHRYALSGSIVKYIDQAYGRKVLSELMLYSDVNDILSRLGLTEEGLIKAWRETIVK